MSDAVNQWMLFGVDMRRFGQVWAAAWRDLLFADQSPLRRRLDEPVALDTGAGVRVYQGGVPAADLAPDTVDCRAQLLPDALVLTRSLTLPVAAEAELPAVIEMEVAAGSPFAANDTVYGWTERRRDDRVLEIDLAIASGTAIARWLQDSLQDHAPNSRDALDWAGPSAALQAPLEVWARVDDSLVTLRGFGEAHRDAVYRRRLWRCAAFTAVALVMLVVAAGLFTLQQKIALERFENLQATVVMASREASALRERLVNANERIGSAAALVDEYPNPHLEIARLTDLLGDGVFIAHFSAKGRVLRVRGRADDAASMMQTLAETGAFARVTAPQAITAVGNSGLEQFYLDIELAPPAMGDDES